MTIATHCVPHRMILGLSTPLSALTHHRRRPTMKPRARLLPLLAGAAILACSAGTSFAATVINVTEDGEGGGAMSLKLDPPTVKAGPATFAVHNDAMTEQHGDILSLVKPSHQGRRL